jgi:hypothetical protein
VRQVLEIFFPFKIVLDFPCLVQISLGISQVSLGDSDISIRTEVGYSIVDGPFNLGEVLPITGSLNFTLAAS